MWLVGKPESLIFRVYENGVELSTGSATVRFRRNQAGSDQYLQSDESTWGTGVQTFSLTFVSGVGWRRSFTPPASAQGYNVHAEYAHSGGQVGSEEHYVTVKDLDSALVGTGSLDGAHVRGA